jgi:excisionase family DNA binding protein
MSTSVEQRTISVNEAAKILGVSRFTAHKALRNQQVPYILVGSRKRIPTAALNDLVTNRAK